ncbi:MAG: hypothetical protein IJ325_07095 [Clostridia bacterium]|nr:hypothetical protein [Clostridia bacterium]
MNGESAAAQNIFIYQRQRAHLCGIEEVESFTDTEIVALSCLGAVSIIGEELKIDNFSTGSGELEIHGKIESCCYFSRDNKVKKGFLNRLTK